MIYANDIKTLGDYIAQWTAHKIQAERGFAVLPATMLTDEGRMFGAVFDYNDLRLDRKVLIADTYKCFVDTAGHGHGFHGTDFHYLLDECPKETAFNLAHGVQTLPVKFGEANSDNIAANGYDLERVVGQITNGLVSEIANQIAR